MKQQPKKTYTLQEATAKMEHFCAYQERCHKEVVEKLRSMHMISKAIDVIVVHLIQHNFLNEARFAKTYVSGKFRIKAWGRDRLTHELKQRAISKVNINQALATISEAEYIGVFNDLAEKKALSLKDRDVLRKKLKFTEYFRYRGWEWHLVYVKANELFK